MEVVAYIADAGSDTVAVLNTSTDTVTATITVGIDPEGVAVNPDGAEVYVADAGSDAVSVIDTETRLEADTINVGKSPHAYGDLFATVPATGNGDCGCDFTRRSRADQNILLSLLFMLQFLVVLKIRMPSVR